MVCLRASLFTPHRRREFVDIQHVCVWCGSAHVLGLRVAYASGVCVCENIMLETHAHDVACTDTSPPACQMHSM